MTQSNPQLPNNLSGTTGTPSESIPINATTITNATITTTSGTGSPATTTTPGAPPPQTKNTNNRVEGRDYLLQPSATVALLPSIAEERNHHYGNGFPHHIPYHKSISLVEQHQKFMSPPPSADLTSKDNSEVSTVSLNHSAFCCLSYTVHLCLVYPKPYIFLLNSPQKFLVRILCHAGFIFSWVKSFGDNLSNFFPELCRFYLLNV